MATTAKKTGILAKINDLPSGQRTAVYGSCAIIAMFIIGGTLFPEQTNGNQAPKQAKVQTMNPVVAKKESDEQVQAELEAQKIRAAETERRVAEMKAESDKKNTSTDGHWSEVQNLVTQLQSMQQEINDLKAKKAVDTTAGGLSNPDLNSPIPGSTKAKSVIPVAEAPVQASIQVVGGASNKPKKASIKEAPVVAHLPAGSFFEGVFLTGMDASTAMAANKTPTPALLRIKEDAILPNLYKLDVKECFVLGGGYGNLSSERAEIRTQTISCVNDKGETFEGDIEGYLVGEDGKAGVRGKLVSKQGSALAKAFVAGFAGGLGNAFAPSAVSALSINGGTTQGYQYPSADYVIGSGVGQGFQKAGSQLSQFYISMAQQMFPILEIDAQRKVTVVVLKGIDLHKSEKKTW